MYRTRTYTIHKLILSEAAFIITPSVAIQDTATLLGRSGYWESRYFLDFGMQISAAIRGTARVCF